MTDKFHYQDVFKTINIPKSERRLALKTKNLFDVASGNEVLDPVVYANLNQVIDSQNASQAFWEFKDDAHRTYDQLVLTLMKRSLTIAIQHRDLDTPNTSVRASLLITNGLSMVYSSDIRGRGISHNGSASELVIADFKENFFETTANLGLYHQIKRLETDQNESSSAILASAA